MPEAFSLHCFFRASSFPKEADYILVRKRYRTLIRIIGVMTGFDLGLNHEILLANIIVLQYGKTEKLLQSRANFICLGVRVEGMIMELVL